MVVGRPLSESNIWTPPDSDEYLDSLIGVSQAMNSFWASGMDSSDNRFSPILGIWKVTGLEIFYTL
jgi:hypothetical protein